MSESVVFDTSESINYAQLAILKGRLKLESEGMKFKGPSARKAWAPHLGLKPRDSYEKFIEVTQTKMNAILEKKS